jgi:hypothetical protein
VVGALRYLVHTRPDLAQSVSYVSIFMAEPHGDHQAAMKGILRYLAGTRDHGVHYAMGKPRELLLLGYSDSDHDGDIEDSKRTSGILFIWGEVMLYGNHKSRNLFLFLLARLSIWPL